MKVHPAEPWLRGSLAELHPVAAHVLYTFAQTREELARFCAPLTAGDLWRRLQPTVAPVGFHLVHIAGSLDRLTTYLEGRELSGEQLAFLRAEASYPETEFAAVEALLEAQFARTEAVVRSIAPADYTLPRFVGRRQLPTTVGGLMIHLSEHTQRHLGQAVLLAKLVAGESQ